MFSIDEAWIYQNEGEVGRALSDKIKEGVVKREDVWITRYVSRASRRVCPAIQPGVMRSACSKLWNNFHRADLVKKGVLESLEKLQVSYLDLYLIHFPVAFRPDVTEATSPDEVEGVPLEETWLAMEKLVEEGLVRNIGVSNFEIEHLKRVQAVA